MCNTRVQELTYTIGSGAGISYRDPERQSFSNHLGSFEIIDTLLRVKPTEHFSSEIDARRAIETYLLDWEIEADITSNIGAIRFSFKESQVVEIEPCHGPEQPIRVNSWESARVSDGISAQMICHKYPPPPHEFCAKSEEVKQAYRRWKGYHDGKEPLQAMAYFVLTLLEFTSTEPTSRKRREAAAREFQIEPIVLTTIGNLSSERGDASTARKVFKKEEFEELSLIEQEWLDKAVRLIIRQLGQRAAEAPLRHLSMNDLPSL